MKKKNYFLILLLFLLLSLPIATYAAERVVVPKAEQSHTGGNADSKSTVYDSLNGNAIYSSRDKNSMISSEMGEIINSFRIFGIASTSLALVAVFIHMMKHAIEMKNGIKAISIIIVADIFLISFNRIIDTFEWIRGAFVAGGH